jgi:PAS domain S-box-containing protein
MPRSSRPWRVNSPTVLDYATATALVPVSVIAGFAFDDLSGMGSPVLLFLCVITFVAWTRATGPALVATMLIILTLDYFFLQPIHSFALEFKNIPLLALFAVAALFAVWLIGAQRRSMVWLRRGPDEEQVTVRHLQEVNEALRTENVESKRIEESARLAEERLQAIIDTIPALVARRGADGVIDFVNLPWRTFTGLSQENPQGLEAAAFHPEDRSRIEHQWLSHLAKGEPFDTEYRLLRADGEYRWLFVRRVPLRDSNGNAIAWYEVGYDIEDRKRTEIALRRSEAQLLEAHRELQLTIDSIPVLVAVYEPDGTRSFVNQTWRNYTGLTLKEKTGEAVNDTMVNPGKTYFHYFHRDDVESIENAWGSSLATGEPLQFEVRLLNANAEYRWHTVRRVPLRDGQGHIIKWYSTGFDIDDKKRAESELHAAQAALAHASRVATLGQLSATIAHEVNQPLAAIVANGQACLRFLSRETPDLVEVRDAVEWMVKDGNRAGEVIQRVGRLLRKTDVEKAPVHVNEIINDAVALLQRELNSRNVSLRRELAPALPLAIADRVQLQQVIINLVLNGSEAMQAVTSRPRELLVRSHLDEAHQLVVAVKDMGIGLPVVANDRVFEAFFTTKPNGLGMGLSICRSIIESHGGKLWATCNLGEPGATFQFALPARLSVN